MPRRVIVTGGSRGLGLAIVRRLICEGFDVIAIARRTNDELGSTIETAERARPGSLRFMPFDLSDVPEMAALVKSIRREGGPIYGLVNNAAVGASSVLALMPVADIERVVRLNTVSPIILTRHVVRQMLADGGGRVVNVASIVGFTGYRGLSVYSATKASLIGFTRSLAREVGKRRVTVNAVAPGFLETEMTGAMDDAERAQVIRRSALGRLPALEDVAHAVEFLLGARAESITGTVLTVDAGSTA